jgi:SAM-dependent methyltransferase
LVNQVDQGLVQRGRALEIGCGTGTNAVWLAQRGFDVTALDLAPLAIERARHRAAAAAARACRFEVRNFLTDAPPQGPFDLVFDRGCFHVFSDPREQAQFAARVASVLAPAGRWLSLIGSTEGAPREMGPPRRSAREVLAALEPAVALIALRAVEFSALRQGAPPPKAWYCLSERRVEPAQPSSVY